MLPSLLCVPEERVIVVPDTPTDSGVLDRIGFVVGKMPVVVLLAKTALRLLAELWQDVVSVVVGS